MGSEMCIRDSVWEGQAVRLIGVGVSGLSEARQLSLWDAPDERTERLYTAVRELRKRYGEGTIRRGSELGGESAGPDGG